MPGSPALVRRFAFRERAEAWRVESRGVSAYGYAWRAASPVAAVVLVHGLQSHAQWFAEAAEELVDQRISVYALDRCGSGSSPGVRGDIERFGLWLDEISATVDLARREQPAPVHLVGHCFGANLALGYCLTSPGRTRSLVMLTPGLYIKPDYSFPEKVRILTTGVLRGSTRFRVPQEDELFTRDPEVLAWIKSDTLGARSVTSRCLLEINRMGRWLRREVGAVQAPVLVLEASQDRIADNRRSRELMETKLGPRCHWVTFEAEHFLLAEPCRDQVVAAMVDWFKREVA